jgi:thiol:disulfide interchange protein DsbG
MTQTLDNKRGLPAHLAFFTLCALLALLALARPASAGDYPAPIQSLVDQGVTIKGHFQAPGDMTGYVGTMRGQPLAMYLTKDGKHVLVGSMLDAQGNNLSRGQIQEKIMGPRNAAAWKKLEKRDWIGDGSPDAPVIVYEFTDPKCPYCHKFREKAAPWVDAGKVQIRHIIVGILMQDSPAKAATILGSDDPQAALQRNFDHFKDGGIEVDKAAKKRGHAKMEANNHLMQALGLRGTPSIYYRDDDGVHVVQGVPQGSRMKDVMGGPRP